MEQRPGPVAEFSFVVIREKTKPGCPVVVLFVFGKSVQFKYASRLTVRDFVSIFSTKDAHKELWRTRYVPLETVGPGMDDSNVSILLEENMSRASKMPLKGVETLRWPRVYPDVFFCEYASPL